MNFIRRLFGSSQEDRERVRRTKLVRDLIEALRRSDEDSLLQSERINSLITLGECSVQPLVEELSHDYSGPLAEMALKKLGATAIDPVIQLLENQTIKGSVAIMAISILANIGGTRTVAALERVREHHPKKDVQSFATSVLKQIAETGSYRS